LAQTGRANWVCPRLDVLSPQEVGDALPDQLWLVDAHDVTGARESLDLAVRDVPRALRRSGRAPDEPILPAEDDEGGCFDQTKLSARDAEGLPGLRLSLLHDQHPGTKLAIHALALA
jgi:hypothetical protein